ncbi:MAG: hypothetical protein N3F10_00750 [Candidatus Bathyarchaeota archaeon]|nr:hypothetical protein [Candidatus Bathyarchaeota archaeon]MCX8176821.1 hypothetical protein [Candidatus Bathyarchaeota archaeon]MDW8194586.1 trypco2 family protein [Nitrososphaerota archaeon]
MPKKEKELGIYELVKGVRAEIKKLLEDSEIKEEPFFELDSLDLELNVVISNATETGIKFFIISAGAKYEKEQVSKIKLGFKPIEKLRIMRTEIKRSQIDLRKSKSDEVEAKNNT